MKLAHLILAHVNPAQLDRLITRLEYGEAHFYIHLDRKTAIEPFLFLAKKKNVYFIKKREKVYWAGYSIVQATLNGLKEILASGNYDYINLISGQDYPIKNTAYIHKYLSARPGKAFMHTLSVNEDWREAIPRIKKYHLINLRFFGKYKIEAILNKIMPDRKFPFSMVPVGRSQWFTLTPACAAYILKYMTKHPKYRWFFRLSWAPDEMIFHTILYNSSFRDTIVNDNLLYVDWSEGKPSPKLLTMEDAEPLKNSDKLFARKFNIDIDSKILDYLDNLAASNQ
jgi:hypothetical protein